MAVPKESSGAAYMHIVQYDNSLHEHLDKGRKINDFCSHRFSQYFHIDIDAKDHLSEAKKLLVSFVETLCFEFDIDIKWLLFYWSGSKGFHISIPSILFNITPHRQLEEKCKSLTSKMISDHGINEYVDKTLYQRNRWLRLPNSRHPISNLFKVPLSWHELSSFSIDEIKSLAKAPRQLGESISPSELNANPGLSKLWQECLSQSIKSHFIDTRQLLSVGVNNGERHNIAFIIIRELRDEGLNHYEIKRKIETWNLLNRPPISEGSWPDSQIKSALNYSDKSSGRHSTHSLASLMRNHQVFRTNLLSDAEYRCVITMLSRTNTEKKFWQEIEVYSGQLITSHSSLGNDAHPKSVKDPETVARNAIKKLIKEGVLVKLKQLSGNRGILYEWKSDFSDAFLECQHHPSTSSQLTTPGKSSNLYRVTDSIDSIENLITPIDHLFMSSTKKVHPKHLKN